MCAIFQFSWVRKLTGKPAFLTIADSESETPRIHLTDYEDVLSPVAAESNAFRIQSDVDWLVSQIALAITLISPGEKRAERACGSIHPRLDTPKPRKPRHGAIQRAKMSPGNAL